MLNRWPYLLGVVLLFGRLSGCQCCALTNHAASAVDCVADHEHHLDVLYHPGLDLTRIGRPDWCQCGINQWLCHCRCDCRKPLPHIVETSAGASVGMNCPWDSSSSREAAESRDDNREGLDGELNEDEVEKALDGIPDTNEGAEAIPLLTPTEDESPQPSATHGNVWSLER